VLDLNQYYDSSLLVVAMYTYLYSNDVFASCVVQSDKALVWEAIHHRIADTETATHTVLTDILLSRVINSMELRCLMVHS
jgi:hypothetical protein